jgi:hypothetical protein
MNFSPPKSPNFGGLSILSSPQLGGAKKYLKSAMLYFLAILNVFSLISMV